MTETRDEMLRRVLVATVDAGTAPPRSRWHLAVGSLAAFALAGALTGGAVAGVARPEPTSILGEMVEISAPPILDDDVQILGVPFVITAGETSHLDLGLAPDSADGLAIAIYCLAPGNYRVFLDGQFEIGNGCDEASQTGIPSGGGGGIVDFRNGRPPTKLAVEAPSGAYALWAAWVDRPDPVEPSAAQQESMADGVVTREEYLAGLDRYVACMAEVGFVVSLGSRDSEIVGYVIPGPAGRSGDANRCYEVEFRDVDIEWQVAHPQTSIWQKGVLSDGEVTREEYLDTFDRFVACVDLLGFAVEVGNREDEVLTYSVESGNDAWGASAYCYDYEFRDVDTAWQKALAD
jgi:hypothetical protein